MERCCSEVQTEESFSAMLGVVSDMFAACLQYLNNREVSWNDAFVGILPSRLPLIGDRGVVSGIS